MNDFLSHYGVMGMRWGVRRYQDYDGTRIGASADPVVDKSKQKDFTLKKGSEAYRIASSGEGLDHKRKYMSFTKEDREEYKNGETTAALPIEDRANFGEYTYELTKDVVVKNGEEVINDLISKYGDTSIEEAFKTEQEARLKFKDRKSMMKYLDDDFYGWDLADSKNDWSKVDQWAKDETAWTKTRDFVWDVMEQHGDEVFDNYKMQGYDAIIDPFDYVSNIADQPIILLDPADSTKLKKYEALFGR